jgi:hypothetical protein
MAVARVSVVSQPDGVTGGIIITGIIKTSGKGTGVIITIAVITLIIIAGRHPFAGDTTVETVVPSLLVRVIRVEAGRVFFKDIGSVTRGEMPTVAPSHKAHFVSRWLLRTDHGIHLVEAGGLQRRWPLVPGLIMRVTS